MRADLPAQSALLPKIVDPGLLTGALALSSATWSSSALIGPALAGVLLVGIGPALIFVITAQPQFWPWPS